MHDQSRFVSDWLTLREPIDHRSRSAALIGPLERHLRGRGPGLPMIVDLGAGSGSNLRYLAPRLGIPARWMLLDHDVQLLNDVPPDLAAGGRVETCVADLSAPLGPVLAGADLVTASALLDLVSADWINVLCEACVAIGAAVLMALTVDGRIVFSEPDPQDAWVGALVARSQSRDKGLGLALGGKAPDVLIQTLGRHHYQVTVCASDWCLDHADSALVSALIDGWREAAQRECPQEADAITDWAARRMRDVAAGPVRLRVGHMDVLAVPGRYVS